MKRATVALLPLGAALVVMIAGCGGGSSRSATGPVDVRRHAIVPQEGMAGLKLGLTEDQVTAKLGRPSSTALQTESERGGDIAVWRFRRRKLELMFRTSSDRPVLTPISTRDPRNRTVSGLGVGSSQSAVRSALPEGSCAPADPGLTWCTLSGGDRQTLFKLHRGRVYDVTITVVFP